MRQDRKSVSNKKNTRHLVNTSTWPQSWSGWLILFVILAPSFLFITYNAFTDPSFRIILIFFGICFVPWLLWFVALACENKKIRTFLKVIVAIGLLIFVVKEGSILVEATFNDLATAPAWVGPLFLIYLWSRPKQETQK